MGTTSGASEHVVACGAFSDDAPDAVYEWTPETTGPGTIATCGSIFDRGLCQPTCDVLLQDCASGDGCYLTLQTGVALCAAPSVAGMQGDACMFVNACAPGYGCILPNDPVTPTGLVCAFFCDALGGSPGCADGPGPAFTCVAIKDFYADAPPDIPDSVGLCVDPNVFPSP
jgi:hypothetical protein